MNNYIATIADMPGNEVRKIISIWDSTSGCLEVLNEKRRAGIYLADKTVARVADESVAAIKEYGHHQIHIVSNSYDVVEISVGIVNYSVIDNTLTIDIDAMKYDLAFWDNLAEESK